VLGVDISDAELRANVGGSGLREQMLAFGGERADELVQVYREHNEPLHDGLECCIGMLDVLERLHGEGRRLGIVTAKRRASVELAFARLPLRDYFEVVVGSEDTERHKPSPDPILHALERLGADPGSAAYVGDSPFDIAAARAAGLPAIGVTWGGIHDLTDADVLVSTPEELLDAL
jgi:pyrophosphatase PpaX